MGIVFRQSVKTSIVIFSGALLGALVIYLSTKYIQDKQQFGFIKNITLQAVLLSQVLLMGFSLTLAVYIHNFENDEQKKKALLTITLLIPLLMLAFATTVYFVFKPIIISHYQSQDIKYVQQYYWLLPVCTLLLMYQVLIGGYLGSQMKVAVAAFMTEIVVRVANIILIVLFGFNLLSFNFLVIGSVLIYGIPLLFFYPLCLRTKNFGFNFNLKVFSKAELRDIIKFTWYHALLLITIILLGSLDSFMLPLSDRKGLSSVPVYAIAVFFISFLQLPYKAMLAASFPGLAKAFRDNDQHKAKDIFVRTSINILIPTVGLAVIIACNLPNAVAVIKNGYNEIIPITLILMVGKIFDLSTGMNDQVLSVAKYYKFNFYLTVPLVLLMFFLTRILIHKYSIYGAAWSSSIIYILYNVFKLFFIYKKLNMQPYSIKSVYVFIAGLLCLFIGYYLPYMFNPYVDTVVRSFVIVVIYVLLLLWMKPSPDLSEYILSIKKNKRLF